VSLSEERARGRRAANAMSSTQHVSVACPTCRALVFCCVESGRFAGVLEYCHERCDLDPDYDHESLEERAELSAVAQRHDVEFGEA
jgi:hypothetical protein